MSANPGWRPTKWDRPEVDGIAAQVTGYIEVPGAFHFWIHDHNDEARILAMGCESTLEAAQIACDAAFATALAERRSVSALIAEGGPALEPEAA